MIRYCLAALAIFLLACEPSSSTSSESTEAAMVAEFASQNRRTITPDLQAAADGHLAQMQQVLRSYDQRDKAASLVHHSLPLGGFTNPVVSVFQGEVQAVSWNDMDAGVNGLITAYFVNGELLFWEAANHGNDWFTYFYSYPDPTHGIIPFEVLGEYPQGGEDRYQMSIDDKVMTYSTTSPVQEKARLIYQAAIRLLSGRELMFSGTLGKEAIEMNLQRDGNCLRGEYHSKTAAIALVGEVLGDSLWLIETQHTDTLAFIRLGKSAKGQMVGTRLAKEGGGGLQYFSLQASRSYTDLQGQTSYATIFGEPAAPYLLLHDQEMPYEARSKWLEDGRAFSSSIMSFEERGFTYLQGDIVSAMMNGVVPQAFEGDKVNTSALFNYFYYFGLAQPPFVKAGAHTHSYYSELSQSDFGHDQQLMAYQAMAIDRSPATVEAVWKVVGDRMMELLTPQEYANKEVGPLLQEWLSTYDQLVAMPNYQHRLEITWQCAHFHEQQQLGQPVEASAEIRAGHPDCLHTDHASGYTYGLPGLGFWARRRHEGNMYVIHRILREIRDHYADVEIPPIEEWEVSGD